MTALATADSHRPRPSGAATGQLYDVIVIGAQLGGTIAGALLARRGYRVLHVDLDGLGAFYQDQGYDLPYAPALLPSLKHLPAAEAALNELGIAVDLNRTLDASATDLQLLFPRQRLAVPREAAARHGELAREFGAEKPRIAAALDAALALTEEAEPFFKNPPPLPPQGFFERRAVRKALSATPALERARAVLEPLDGSPMGMAAHALAQFLIYLDEGEAAGIAWTRPLAHVLKSAHRFPGGVLGLRDNIRRRLGELGGDTLGAPGDPAVVEEVAFEGSQITGLKLASSGGLFRGRCVIGALDIGALGRLIPPKEKKHGLSDLFESVRTMRYLFPVNLVIREPGLPLGLGTSALLIGGDPELGPLLLELLPARKGGHDVPGERVLSAAAFVKGSERGAGEARLREIAGRIEAAAIEIAPFVEPHVIARSSPYLDAKGIRGSRLLPHPLLEIAHERFLGVTGLPHRTPCKNLFLASREVLPGLGLEGELMAGLRAAGLVQEVLRKHDPLR